ncbi:hypothetical protein UA08_05608 [Talaromyces atroroseus]|uniref:Barwin domain-containing protein n=1 Tax=Talaromyces atroroseus TaxID=1441469 RepID=A0A225AVS5_TALAT|nr:hypothetical protein UA08_05608 [Talaromyces atroroseus]OKL59066.1 hypothetical protein UA08_05608 [Talaromyces atroroseus]
MKAQTIVAAAAALFGITAKATFSGTGFGTWYYDLEESEICGYDVSSLNNGNALCGWYTARTLEQVGSEYLVAMNDTQLKEDLTGYCGMQVIVTVNGVTSDLPFFIGDGCQRCSEGSPDATTYSESGAPGLDFSYPALNALSGGEACDDGYIEISWEITDNKIYDLFDA